MKTLKERSHNISPYGQDKEGWGMGRRASTKNQEEPSNKGQMYIIISDPYSGQEDGLRHQVTWQEILALLLSNPGQVYKSNLFGLQMIETQFEES